MAFNENLPIYTQLIVLLQHKIASGEYGIGEKLPSRRDVAQEYGINPNTVQRAFKEMEEDGVVETRGNLGSFVTEDMNKIQRLRHGLLKEATDRYFSQIQAMNISREELKVYLEDYIQRLEGGDGDARN